MRARLFLVVVCFLGVSACRRPPAAPTSIVLSVPYEVDTLDPHAKDRLGNSALASHLYEPLVAADTEMGIHPSLSIRWDTPDLVTWVFHLRPGVTFHDGKPFTAEDVVYTLERLRTSPDLEIGLYAVQITSVRALEPLLVEVKTRRPMGVLLNKLSRVKIVAKDATTQSLVGGENGTGPYRMLGWKKGEQLRLTAFERYWGPKPAVSTVTFQLGRSPEEALRDLLSGKSEFAQCPTRDAARAVSSRSDLSITRRTGGFLKYLAFDLANDKTPFVSLPSNPFRKQAVRQAVSMSIDRKVLTGSLSTFAVPASQFVPPFIFGFDPERPELRHDPARARSLLADVGLSSGFDVTLHARKIVAETARLLVPMLGQAGIRVTVVEQTDPEFFAVATRHTGSFYLSRFGCASGDISDILDSGFHSVDESRRFGTSNFGSFSDAALDRAIEESAEILEAADRRRTLHGLVSRIVDDYLWVPLYYDEDVYAVKKPFFFKPRADSYILAAEIALQSK